MASPVQTLFHLICSGKDTVEAAYEEDYFQRGFSEAKKFFQRFDGQLDVEDKTVLDVGCGFGSLCVHMARNGAKRVVGVDVDRNRIAFAQSKLADECQDVADRVAFHHADEIPDSEFDCVVSKDSFEHLADPDDAFRSMKHRLAKGGRLAIGFGPLWKSPYGGHLQFMTRFPWAHLIFPESVIMTERKRFRPEEKAESFEQVVGGMNKMTLQRFTGIIETNGLVIEHFATNVSNHPAMRVFNVLRHVPFGRELFTLNVYCVMRAP